MREFVADVGNTRIKTGRCAAEGLIDPEAWPVAILDQWTEYVAAIEPYGEDIWTIAGTNPEARDRYANWILQYGDTVRIIDDYRQLPMKVQVDFPDQVGIDRLLNALAVLKRVSSDVPIVIVDAGSAVTVDLVDGDGVFRGGAILPGFRLMAKSLNDYTARLPLIASFPGNPPLPGMNTVAAIEAGIAHSIVGGVERIVARYAEAFGKPRIFIAGGDADLLAGISGSPEIAGPFLTLEGIRIAARGLS